MMKQDIGIQKENVIYIPVRGDLKTKYDLFKSQLLLDPSVKSVTLSSHLPTGIWSNGGGYKWQGKPAEVDPLVSITTVDFDYAKTLGIEIAEGEFYTENIYRDTAKIVINKTFADIIGIKPIIGEFIEKGGQQMKIIGVTENFNFKPLFSKIEPLVMYCIPENHQYLLCKVSTENLPKTISKMQDLHNSLNGTFPFEYHFLDEDYDNLYNNEARQGRIFNIFSFLAIFISCLGLFGLASFMMVQRTKEIGIRKSNGALVLNIMTLFSKYYTRWVIVSFVLAAPVSYYMSKGWLKDYAYKTPISWWIFLLAGLIAFAIALLTVSWQSWRAASKNPVDALRYE
jgi:putative ABC transport system permease protein